jgi:ribonuclease HII
MQNPNLTFEKKLWKKGFTLVAGIDEAGRGAWAGPVAAGVVILPADPKIIKKLSGVRDSKQMTARQRSLWAERIKELAVAWSVGLASNMEIDQLGILPATRLAMKRAIQILSIQPQQLLIDAVKLPDVEIPQTNLIKGDVRVLSIAAASVLAKTTRDAIMCELDKLFPEYGFAHHKGYGTAYHREQLQRHGASSVHRFSYAPIRELKIRK